MDGKAAWDELLNNAQPRQEDDDDGEAKKGRLVSTLYDKFVTKAAASKTLFDSIFPSNVPDRVLDIDKAVGENYDPVERS